MRFKSSGQSPSTNHPNRVENPCEVMVPTIPLPPPKLPSQSRPGCKRTFATSRIASRNRRAASLNADVNEPWRPPSSAVRASVRSSPTKRTAFPVESFFCCILLRERCRLAPWEVHHIYIERQDSNCLIEIGLSAARMHFPKLSAAASGTSFAILHAKSHDAKHC